jgi:hypothetical protein
MYTVYNKNQALEILDHRQTILFAKHTLELFLFRKVY